MHVNPPAEVSTSMKVLYPGFSLNVFVLNFINSKVHEITKKKKDNKMWCPLMWKSDEDGTKRVYCVSQVYQGHTLEKTYLGEDFFWAITPTAGDYVLFKFDRPVSIERYVFALCLCAQHRIVCIWKIWWTCKAQPKLYIITAATFLHKGTGKNQPFLLLLSAALQWFSSVQLQFVCVCVCVFREQGELMRVL